MTLASFFTSGNIWPFFLFWANGVRLHAIVINVIFFHYHKKDHTNVTDGKSSYVLDMEEVNRATNEIHFLNVWSPQKERKLFMVWQFRWSKNWFNYVTRKFSLLTSSSSLKGINLQLTFHCIVLCLYHSMVVDR